MKRLLILLPLTIAFTSCSPSLSDVASRQLDKAAAKKVISYQKATKKGWSREKILPEKAQLIENIDFTADEKDEIAKGQIQMAKMGMNDVSVDTQKILVKLEYKAPTDGFVYVNNDYFESKELLDRFLAQEIKNKTHKRECAKYSRGYSFYGPSCSKYKSVKLKGADKIAQDLKNKYAKPKIFKKGQVVHSGEYLAGVMVISAKGNEEAKIDLKKYKREIASSK